MSALERKAKRTETVEPAAPSAAIGKALGRALPALATELAPEEEQAVRMRHGAKAPKELVLERKASGELLDELFVMELELRRRYREHLARSGGGASARKDKIVRSLRRKPN